ncbi:hypothetical protein JB92DRAFT_3141125 [Gautieria morchelliformis]|nr:hypothetical protein JB92DRAFT_3141125 [Gautieria morchelliformis]
MSSTLSKLHCTCEKYCNGGEWVSRATWFRHANDRTNNNISGFQPSWVPPVEQAADSSAGSQDSSGGDGNGVRDSFEDDRDDHWQPHHEPNTASEQSPDDDSDLAPDPGNLREAQEESDSPTRTPSVGSPSPEPHDDASAAGSEDGSEPLPTSNPWSDPNFTPNVEELQDSLNFIRALRNASLDNGDLSEHYLIRLRNPPTHELRVDNPDELYSLKQYIASENASEKTYMKFAQNHNHRYRENPMLSLDQVKSRVAEWSGVVPIENDMCPNSCLAYAGPFRELDRCSHCGQSRYRQLSAQNPRQERKSQQNFYTIPLGPQLQALMRSPESAHRMNYRYAHTEEVLEELRKNGGKIHTYNDIFHGSEYLQAYIRGDIKPNDFVVMFSMDGAELVKDKGSNCWIGIYVVMDLAPDTRYLKISVLKAFFLPGPNSPVHMDSFMFPSLHHIAGIQKEGLAIWNAAANTSYLSQDQTVQMALLVSI